MGGGRRRFWSDPDHSLERGGVALREWLWRLVDADCAVREAAGDALQAMELGLPSVHTDLEYLTSFPDHEAQRARFEAGVRAAVNEPGFETAELVRRLAAYRLALEGDLRRRAREEREGSDELGERYDRLAGKVTDRIRAAEDDAERKRAVERLVRLSAAYAVTACAPKADSVAGAESHSFAHFAARRVFECLGEELLAAPEALEAMLEDRGLRSDAYAALTRIGPPALSFVPRLIAQVDRLAETGDRLSAVLRRGGSEALGAVGRGHPPTVDALIARLGHDAPLVRIAAAQALRHMGTGVCGREAEVLERLWPMADRDREQEAAVMALASVGRHSLQVRRFLCDRARPRPARMRAAEDFPQYRYDQVMVERGAAISAMAYLEEHAEECLDVLVAAMEDFEEPVSDEEDRGPQGRISAVLGRFGPRAAAAAPALAAHLGDFPGECPRAILEALGAMGPAAAGVLPRLEPLRRRYAMDEPLADLDAGPLDPEDDPVGWAIQRLRGLG